MGFIGKLDRRVESRRGLAALEGLARKSAEKSAAKALGIVRNLNFVASNRFGETEARGINCAARNGESARKGRTQSQAGTFASFALFSRAIQCSLVTRRRELPAFSGKCALPRQETTLTKPAAPASLRATSPPLSGEYFGKVQREDHVRVLSSAIDLAPATETTVSGFRTGPRKVTEVSTDSDCP